MTKAAPSLVPWGVDYKSRIPNAALNETFVAAARSAGLDPALPTGPGRASSDFGDVSRLVPAAHLYFRIAKQDAPGHSPEFARAAGSAFAIEQTLRVAEAMAVCGHRFLTEPAFRKEVRAAFRARKQRLTADARR